MLRYSLVVVAGLMGCASANPKPVEPVSPSDEPAQAAPAPAVTKPAAAPHVSASAPAAEEPAPPEPPRFPTITGTLEGKPFELRGAGTAGPVQKNGEVLVALASYAIECGAHETAEGDQSIVVMVPWKDGEKVDLSKLGTNGVWAMKVGKAGPTRIKGFKPSGAVEVLMAPGEAGKTGRVRFEIKSGKDAIAGEVPVKVCF